MKEFRERVDTCSSIRQILNSYNLGPGLLRELLQNSDDSGAKRQTFILDTRQYGVKDIVDPALSATQGAALVAINDSKFSDKDWVALRSIGDSSKVGDESKTGKYGLGFRACYHVTDHPHVLSGDRLIVLDPQENFAGQYKGGFMADTMADLLRYPDQAAPFRAVAADVMSGFDGTIIRLPLRSPEQAVSSGISKRPCSQTDVHELFASFMKEIDIQLLFLKNISSIDLMVASEGGIESVGSVSLSPADVRPIHSSNGASLRHITLEITTIRSSALPTTCKWHLVHFSMTDEETSRCVAARVGRDVRSDLKDNKLSGRATVAVPETGTVNGRLFNLLPLPIFTGFPVHINAMLSLMSDRQHLKNPVDDVVDSLHVEWNRFIFDSVVPTAYAKLVEVVSSMNAGLSVQNMLPPVNHNPTNDQLYWHNITVTVVDKLVAERYSIWPVLNFSDGPADYKVLDEVIFLNPSIEHSDTLLVSLNSANVSVCRIHRILYDVIAERACTLSPATLHTKLAARHRDLGQLDRAGRLEVLRYLLTTRCLAHIDNLPLIPLLDGRFAAFNRSTTFFIFVSGQEGTLFQGYDPRLASVDEDSIIEPLRALAPQTFLSPDHVVEYVRAKASPALPQLHWLIEFWKWLDSWSPHAPSVIERLQGLDILPGRGDILHRVGSSVLDARELTQRRIDALALFNIPILHSGMEVSAGGHLSTSKVIRRPADLPHFFAHVQIPRLPIAIDTRQEIQRHVVEFLPTFPRDQKHDRLLRTLPIFPTINPLNMSQTLTPAIGRLVFVEMSQSGVLPLIPGQVYIDVAAPAGRSLAGVLDRGFSRAQSEVSLLQLAVQHIESQPALLMDNLLLRILIRFEDLSPSSRRQVSGAKCIPIGDGQRRRRPLDVIDPSSQLAKIFPSKHERFPSETCSDRLLQLLRKLSLLQTSLTQEILDQAIHSLSGDYKRALSLLAILDDHFKHGKPPLFLSGTVRWVPVGRNDVASADACRDQHESFLFDRVLPVVPRRISPNLRDAFGWSELIPLNTIASQLQALATSEAGPSDFLPICKHLASRNIQGEDVASLVNALGEVRWIPTADGSSLASTSFAVFGDVHHTLPFKKVHFDLLSTVGSKDFLGRMGCQHRPSKQALLRELGRMSAADTGLTLRLLEELSSVPHLSHQDLRDLKLPDLTGCLRHPSQLYVPDMGPSHRTWTPSDRFAVHPGVSTALCRDIPWLSTLLAEENPDDDEEEEEMAEDLAGRVKDALRDYGVNSASNEIIANACDAHAEVVKIRLDDQQFPQENLLCDRAGVCQGPALLFYNNATFSDADFKGIRRVGEGGKLGDGRSIGRFGLGALSYFHFTEVAMILSGDVVLFLDPSKTYLPKRRSAFKRRLSVMRSQYAGHLQAFDGHFGFKLDMDHFAGTIIRLPLRATPTRLCTQTFTSGSILNLINGKYLTQAKHSFFFTQLRSIQASNCNPQGLKTLLWQLSATRSAHYDDETFHSHTVELEVSSRTKETEAWMVARHDTGKSAVPSKFHDLFETAKLASPQVGVAVHLPRSSPTASLFDLNLSAPKEVHSLFSTLPLPEDVQLPMHLHGTFVLAPDRRNIRFNKISTEKGSVEEQFNNWMLSDLVPLVYLFAIERFIRATQRNQQTSFTSSLWPRPSRSADTTSVSHTVSEGLYNTHLPRCTRLVFRGLGGALQAVKDSLFSYMEPTHALNLLISLDTSNLVIDLGGRLPLGPCLKDYTITAAAVRSQLVGAQSRIQALYRAKRFTVSAVNSVLDFLLEEKESVIGLPLMPLRDGSLGIYPPLGSPNMFVLSLPLPPSLFPTSRFLSTELRNESLQLLVDNPAIPIQCLDSQGVVDLVSLRLKRQDIAFLTEEEEEWSSHLCSFARLLPMGGEDLKAFPLIPANDGQSVSLVYCLSNPVLAVDSKDEIYDALAKCGAVIIQKPLLFAAQLLTVDFSLLSVLRFFASITTSARHPILALPPKEHHIVAAWLRANIDTRFQRDLDQYQQTVLALPIWEASFGNGPATLLAAQDVEMAKAGWSLEAISCYLDRNQAFASYSPALQKVLKGSPGRILTQDRLIERIRLPPRLQQSELQNFKAFLLAILPLGFADASTYRLPNVSRILVPPSELYSRTIPLFASAFRQKQHLPFLHPDLVNTRAIQPHIRHDINIDTVLACAMSVDEVARRGVDDSELLDMAGDVFSHYNGSLPIELASDTEGWTRFSQLRFVRRAASRGSASSFDINQYCTELPSVVTPSQICLPERAAISWTQRVTATQIPSVRLRMANATFGQPDAWEVVEHLVVLTTRVAVDHPRNSQLLSDLKATYSWLDEHFEVAEEYLRQKMDVPMFLNVDKPNEDEWKWRPANSLILNLQYDDQAQGIFSIRKYLIGFRHLLLAAGVRVFQKAELASGSGLPPQDPATEGETIRSRYNEMRHAKETDILLKAKMGGDTFHAHRFFLAAVVPHFRYLISGWKENHENTSEISCSGMALKLLLDFIYTGDFEVSKPPQEALQEVVELTDVMLELLDESNKMDMPSLQTKVTRSIVLDLELVQPETLGRITDAAKLYGATALEKACLDYAKANELLLPLLEPLLE